MRTRFLTEELEKRGYNEAWSGTQSIRQAIDYCLTAERTPAMTKELYPALAKAAGKSPAAVERSMRYAVSRAEPGRTVGAVVHGFTALCKAYDD